MGSLNERIIAAVTPVVPVCVPDLYNGEEPEYCTFNYTEIPVGHGDNAPHACLDFIQVHYFCPLRQNSIAIRRALSQAILQAGFTAPVITPATDDMGQHYIFEFEDVV